MKIATYAKPETVSGNAPSGRIDILLDKDD
jgi:hypothetical protein